MKPHNKEQKVAGGRNKSATPRFRIEKLEERIAPTHKAGHYPPGQSGGGYWPQYCHWHGKHWCKG